ncbi:prenyltransferase/squalene oxidase repeat-containing protein [Stratiformator vulcanicus]|uniref:Prenyltransferase and squalene oxidase repeat protein n=1 Tax=Stratiformator vulcanicus TaxID=2527980 RepID=A0A517QZK4_9PLAN|nr:prenyltransferase/squalene oxidase repeat-containing protein [Stratiformator vulcanicus]QDT37034.1 Prenyltransferase and squalene oxidase repeat protein [Stratiformator vulcanicus]
MSVPKTAISRGTGWLLRQQHKDGSFGSGRVFDRSVAVTSLCGLSMLSGGHLPGGGPEGEAVENALQYVLSQRRAGGLISNPKYVAQGPMYDHGFAIVFLTQIYGEAKDNQLIREAISDGVRLIIDAQTDQGGWRYQPNRKEADISVTTCQLTALRAARDVGIAVPKDTIEKGVGYVLSCRNEDGGFRYQPERDDPSQFARSAAACATLFSAGTDRQDEFKAALNFISQYRPLSDQPTDPPYYYYGHYYAAQSMWWAGKKQWTKWYPAIRSDLIDRQRESGQWLSQTVCPEYSTAMALIVLQMPNDLLPLFER